ncbi:ABC-type transport system involved in cytochrome c biogenesis, permease component [Desulfitobacterium dichloroeliminans LMG P-21439]|uniref:Heme exporter protein C n=1 Tax=Desulfitobacterium dichloroeliminans (strain LMG P-21439 / DCA1) TaxID=871963 RepID=L0F6M0_DESDL|nr:cytochrome c biogenesis protein CcsA [Desulfitobacterium dichloroeliminans]AGA68665.1 ABC-type transport system involved in cytochrome c biogenesis, permease component [Desulfitobacterium dichloroeliminans LMG P-21439]
MLKKLVNRYGEKILAWATFITMFLALYMALVYAPTEKTMGDIQRLFYFHVASAWLGMLAFFVVFLSSILYLIKREKKWDNYAYTSAEIGVIFTTIVLVTGPIWARPIWQTWWTWDPRLTTTLIMWFLYIAYVKIRSSLHEDDKRSRYAAVFGILAFTDVPIVFFSIRWWRTMHPGAIVSGSGLALAPDMKLAFYMSLLAFTLLYLLLMVKGSRIETLRAKITALKETLR